MFQTLKDLFRGRKTIWVSRIYIVVGILVALKDIADVNGFSITPYLPEAVASSVYWPLVLVGTGMLFEGLRRITYTAAYNSPIIEEETKDA